MVFFWYCTIAPLTETTDVLLNGTSTRVLVNFDMVRLKPFQLYVQVYVCNPQYKWNLICLAPGLLLYILRLCWRKFYETRYGLKDKPIPGSGGHVENT